MRMQQEVRNKESRWTEAAPKNGSSRKGGQNGNEERSKKHEVHPAQWVDLEHREKVHEKIQRKVRHLFGMEHRMRKEEMEEEYNKEAKKGWRFALMQEES